MTILTENDWNRMQNALSRMERDKIEREYKPACVSVEVSTGPANNPWPVAMIVTIKAYFKGGCWHQHFESVAKAKRALKEWTGWQ